jgi:hypothetical protein
MLRTEAGLSAGGSARPATSKAPKATAIKVLRIHDRGLELFNGLKIRCKRKIKSKRKRKSKNRRKIG